MHMICEVQCFLMTYGFTTFIEDPTATKDHVFKGCATSSLAVDILLIDSDEKGISTTKAYLPRHFVTQDMQTLCYLLGIEFSY